MSDNKRNHNMTSTKTTVFAVYEKDRITEQVKLKEVFDNFHDAHEWAEDMMDIHGEDKGYKVVKE